MRMRDLIFYVNSSFSIYRYQNWWMSSVICQLYQSDCHLLSFSICHKLLLFVFICILLRSVLTQCLRVLGYWFNTVLAIILFPDHSQTFLKLQPCHFVLVTVWFDLESSLPFEALSKFVLRMFSLFVVSLILFSISKPASD